MLSGLPSVTGAAGRLKIFVPVVGAIALVICIRGLTNTARRPDLAYVTIALENPEADLAPVTGQGAFAGVGRRRPRHD